MKGRKVVTMKFKKHARKQEESIKCEILPSKPQWYISQPKIVCSKFNDKENRGTILLGKKQTFFERIFSRKKEDERNQKFVTLSELKKLKIIS